MNDALSIDTREFDKALKSCVGETSKTLPEALNHKGGNVAFTAYKQTPAVDPKHIAAEFSAQRVHKIGKKGQTLKATRLEVGDNLRARAVFVAQLRRRGLLEKTTGVTGKIAAFIGKRIGSAGFLRQGWVPAIKRLKPGIFQQTRRAGKKVGSVIPAKDGFNVFAQIENNATPRESSSVPKVQSLMTNALARAFREETADMETYLARKAQESANKVNAK